MRAAIYTRISRDKTGEAAGVTRQREDCRTLAASLGWTVVGEYEDNDISATSGKIRPAFRRLLADVKAREVEAIVVWHPDRLYRKLADLESLIQVVEGNNVSVRPVQAGEIDLSTASGRGIARILGVVATMEGEQKSERWRRSIRQRRENGQAPGWGPRLFGYTRDSELIPAEADAIRWAATEIIDGRSISSTAAALTEQGFTSTKGNPWTKAALRTLLGNPRLAGHSTLNGNVIGVGKWEPILTQETFTLLQSAFMVRTETKRPPRIALLPGLVHCALCGAALKSARSTKRPGEEKGRRVYTCKKDPRAPGCGRIQITSEPLEEMVELYAKGALDDPLVRNELDRLSAASGENTSEVIALEERLRELEKQAEDPAVPLDYTNRAIANTLDRLGTLRDTWVPPTAVPLSGDWPEDLGRRARLVRLVVADVIVGPAIVRGNKKFEYERVEIVGRGYEDAQRRSAARSTA